MRGHRLRRGAEAPEAVAVILLLVLLLSVAVDYGWFWGQRSVLEHAARTAVRVGATADYALDPVATAKKQFNEEIARSVFTGSVAVDAYVSGARPDERLYFTVRAPYRALFRLVPSPFAHEVDVSMRLERQR